MAGAEVAAIGANVTTTLQVAELFRLDPQVVVSVKLAAPAPPNETDNPVMVPPAFDSTKVCVADWEPTNVFAKALLVGLKLAPGGMMPMANNSQ